MSLSLTGLTVLRDDAPIFPPLDLTVAAGEVATVMGPSGVGKSVLLAAIGGLLPPGLRVRGEVKLGGADVTAVTAERRRIGLMFQDALLFPHLSVGDNLAFGLTPQVRGRAERRKRVENALVRADLAGLYDRDPATLSGGQKARAALMRTLLAEPRALLLDEPFSALDADLRQDMRDFVLGHVREAGIPAILVTHDAVDAEAAGGAVVRLRGSRPD